MSRTFTVYANTITARTPGGLMDTQTFASAEEAQSRAAVCRYALTWDGTPFKDCSDVRGKNGGVDCAMSLVRWFVDTGRLPPFDPRPYPPQWLLHKDEERFLDWVVGKLGGVETEHPSIGDVSVFRFGRTFSHGALDIGNGEIMHAYTKSHICEVGLRCESDLAFLPTGKPRPVKHFRIEART